VQTIPAPLKPCKYHLAAMTCPFCKGQVPAPADGRWSCDNGHSGRFEVVPPIDLDLARKRAKGPSRRSRIAAANARAGVTR
jgi:hypothetical protein